VFAILGFEFARPVGFRIQFIEKSNLRLPLTGGKLGNEIHAGLLLSALYEVSSAVDIMCTYQLNADRIRPEGAGSYDFILHNQVSGIVDFLIAEHLVMSNSVTLNQSSQARGLAAEVSSKISFRFF
jgi:hypothetical protein